MKELPFEREFPYPSPAGELTLRVGRYRGFLAYWIVETANPAKVRYRPRLFNAVVVSAIIGGVYTPTCK